MQTATVQNSGKRLIIKISFINSFNFWLTFSNNKQQTEIKQSVITSQKSTAIETCHNFSKIWIIKFEGFIRNLITVKRLPSECKGKVMSLLSPPASKKSTSIARVMIKSLETFSAGLTSPAKRKFESLLMENCWQPNENQKGNNNDNGDEDFAFFLRFFHRTQGVN